MFKFGFSTEEAEDAGDEITSMDNVEWFDSKEIHPQEVTFHENVITELIKCKDCCIRYVSDKYIINSLAKSDNANSSLLNAEKSHSDLITAIYEGGLKIWECTFDLLHFVDEQNIDFKDKSVLDLGCGAGIIGIFACLKGARTTYFQDYNIDVIKSATIPNVMLNNIHFDTCKFYCGDWHSFLELQKQDFDENKKFDYIFTSETIYNVNNYKKLLNIFKQLLKKSGVIYLAAKCHYFGVGGSIGLFEDHLKKEDIFNYSTCWECSDGMKRAIIKIVLK